MKTKGTAANNYIIMARLGVVLVLIGAYLLFNGYANRISVIYHSHDEPIVYSPYSSESATGDHVTFALHSYLLAFETGNTEKHTVRSGQMRITSYRHSNHIFLLTRDNKDNDLVLDWPFGWTDLSAQEKAHSDAMYSDYAFLPIQNSYASKMSDFLSELKKTGDEGIAVTGVVKTCSMEGQTYLKTWGNNLGLNLEHATLLDFGESNNIVVQMNEQNAVNAKVDAERENLIKMLDGKNVVELYLGDNPPQTIRVQEPDTYERNNESIPKMIVGGTLLLIGFVLFVVEKIRKKKSINNIYGQKSDPSVNNVNIQKRYQMIDSSDRKVLEQQVLVCIDNYYRIRQVKKNEAEDNKTETSLPDLTHLLTSQLVELWIYKNIEGYRLEYLRRMNICGLSDDVAEKTFEYEVNILKKNPRPEMLREDFISMPLFSLVKPCLDNPVEFYKTNFVYPFSYIVKLSDEAEWHFWNSHEKKLPDDVWAEIFALSDRNRALFIPFATDLVENRGWTVAEVNKYSYNEQGMLDKYRWGKQVSKASNSPWKFEEISGRKIHEQQVVGLTRQAEQANNKSEIKISEGISDKSHLKEYQNYLSSDIASEESDNKTNNVRIEEIDKQKFEEKTATERVVFSEQLKRLGENISLPDDIVPYLPDTGKIIIDRYEDSTGKYGWGQGGLICSVIPKGTPYIGYSSNTINNDINDNDKEVFSHSFHPFIQRFTERTVACSENMLRERLGKSLSYGVAHNALCVTFLSNPYFCRYVETLKYIKYSGSYRDSFDDGGAYGWFEWCLWKANMDEPKQELVRSKRFLDCKGYWVEESHLFVVDPWSIPGIFEFFSRSNGHSGYMDDSGPYSSSVGAVPEEKDFFVFSPTKPAVDKDKNSKAE